ncbi:NAD-dependent epimerase/dehydratase family protein [Prochlorococcus marinus]|uniref:NAD-dependent epimerase/dehydratase domain-containing protein n=1 Tax=Prochlorococcus marinus (strain AS9601) TaxID=146891 RepID=A2BSI0_PROMS|nr:SDR family oxidoreductase [Prochlorococcus marinus]ABM70741.1 Hypothetical protein A9601_14581 [Prochlorococcus marinus str. AS9601]
MKVLLTGSNGFLGGNLKDFYIKKPYLLHFYNRQKSYYEILKGNEEFDLIINTASATPKNCDNKLILESNIVNTSKLCNIALKCKVKYFINISSVSVYGKPNTSQLTEDSPLDAKDNYGYSKLLSEEIIDSNLKAFMRVYHFRAPGIIGKGSFQASGNFISTLIHKLKKNIPIEIHSPKSKFNNITSDYSIYRCINHVLQNNIESGAFLIASNQSLLLEELVDFVKQKTKSLSSIKWIEEPLNHQPFIIDNAKCNKFKFPIRKTREELEYYIKEIRDYE